MDETRLREIVREELALHRRTLLDTLRKRIKRSQKSDKGGPSRTNAGEKADKVGQSGTRKGDGKATSNGQYQEAYQEVIEAWIQLGHPGCRMSEKRRKLVRDRLKDGYSTKDLVEAMQGLHRSRWHTGQNPGGKKYLSIERALGEKMDDFRELLHEGERCEGASVSDEACRLFREGIDGGNSIDATGAGRENHQGSGPDR